MPEEFAASGLEAADLAAFAAAWRPERQICARCPVRQPCLNYALSNGITSGIWGGLTERERRPLRSAWVQDARRERDRAILAAGAAGLTTAEIGRSFGLSRTSVTRIVHQGGRTRLDGSEPHAPPLHGGKRESGRGEP